METKICSKCKTKKPVSAFYRRGDRPCGYLSSCKECNLKYRQSKGGKEAQKKYNGSKKRREAKRKYYQTHPERGSAKSAVKIAVETGKLQRVSTLKCANDCGNMADHYHHESYAKEHRLDVTPLCIRCHAAKHCRA